MQNQLAILNIVRAHASSHGDSGWPRRNSNAEEEDYPDSETHVEPKRLLGHEFIIAQPESVQDRLRNLQDVQKKYATLMIEYQKEDLELKKKYLALATPLFKMRYDIVNKSEKSDSPPLDNWSPGCSRGIPGFWLRAMKNHPKISKHVMPDDEELLYHLYDIRLEDLEGNKNGFSLVFEFSSNDYFKDRTLEKKYTYERPSERHGSSEELADDVYDHELTYGEMAGKSISWKKGRNMTFKTNKNGKKQPKTTFFTFFRVPTKEMVLSFNSLDGNGPSFDDEELENMYDWLIGQHYELGEMFKDELIPYALHWYTGQATLYETVDDDGDDDYEDEEEEEYGFGEDLNFQSNDDEAEVSVQCAEDPYWKWNATYKRFSHENSDGTITWAEQEG